MKKLATMILALDQLIGKYFIKFIYKKIELKYKYI